MDQKSYIILTLKQQNNSKCDNMERALAHRLCINISRGSR